MKRKSIDIFGTKVPIKMFTPDESNYRLAGFCQKDPIAIYINDSLSKEQTLRTFYHECGHALIFRLGLDQVLSHDLHEVLCENFATFIWENFNLKK